MPRPPRRLSPGRSVRDYAGAQLRAWRIRRGLSQDSLGTLVHVSGALIGKLEKAERSCNQELAASLDLALGADGAVAAAWHHALTEQRLAADSDGIRTARLSSQQHLFLRETLIVGSYEEDEGSYDPVDRRRFLRIIPAAGVSAAAAGIVDGLRRQNPSHAVTVADLAHMRSVAQFFNSWDYSHGGLTMREVVSAEVAHATGLLRLPCPHDLRPALLSAVAYLSTAAGALIFDSYDHDLAARLFAFAAECAELADDWHLRAKALSWRARQAI